MNLDEMQELALKEWGVETQILLAIEELNELAVALLHDLRGRESNFYEEIADVEIMMQQLRKIYNPSEIDKQKAYKIARLEERLNESKS